MNASQVIPDGAGIAGIMTFVGLVARWATKKVGKSVSNEINNHVDSALADRDRDVPPTEAILRARIEELKAELKDVRAQHRRELAELRAEHEKQLNQFQARLDRLTDQLVGYRGEERP